MSGEIGLGLVSGFRQRRDQHRVEQREAEDRHRQFSRENKLDARADEEYAYKKQQRPKQEELQDMQMRSARRGEQAEQRQFEDAKRAAREEGFFDLMDQLDRGVDPGLALRQYNASGAHKLDPSKFSYDRRTGTVSFVDDDGTPVRGNVRQIKSVLSDSLNPKSSAPKEPIKLKDDEALLDPTTKKPIYSGPKYGKGGETGIKAGTKGKPGEQVWDGSKWVPIPGKAGKGGLPGGSKPGTWSLQNAQKSTREVLAAGVGLKYDPETEQIIGGKPGATERWLELAASADRVLNSVQDTMGPAEVAHLVNEAYRNVKAPEEYVEMARKETQRMRRFDPEKPDIWRTPAEPVEKWEARVQENGRKLYQQALKDAEMNLLGEIPAVGEEIDDGATAEGEFEDEEILNEDDEAPAIEPGEVTGAPTAAAGQRPAPRAHYPVTLDRLSAGADVQAQAALKVVQSDPRFLAALQAPAEPGRATVVKFPDGNIYYLAGTELKRLNMKPPAKGK